MGHCYLIAIHQPLHIYSATTKQKIIIEALSIFNSIKQHTLLMRCTSITNAPTLDAQNTDNYVFLSIFCNLCNLTNIFHLPFYVRWSTILFK